MPRGLCLSLTSVALLVAACGGGGPPEPSPAEVASYRQQVTEISNRFAAAGHRFDESVGPETTPGQAADALERFQSELNTAAGDLDRLRPPATVARPHRQLAATFREMAHAAQPAIDAGRAGNRAAFRIALERMQYQLSGPLGMRARAAATEIDRRLNAESS